jgi:hypothetical protein
VVKERLAEESMREMLIEHLRECQRGKLSEEAEIFMMKLRHFLQTAPASVLSEDSGVECPEDDGVEISLCHLDERIPPLIFALDRSITCHYDTWHYRFAGSQIDYRSDNPFFNPLELLERIFSGDYCLTIAYKNRRPFRWTMNFSDEYVWQSTRLFFNWFRRTTWREITARWLPQKNPGTPSALDCK